jgi:hypothetical protein
MSNLSVFNAKSGIELVINTQTGEAFATQSGYSRMSGKDRTTIVRRCTGCVSDGIEMAEVVTGGGVQRCVLIPAKLVFKWLIKDNPELAAEMGEVGATIFLHKLAGYEIKSNAIQSQPQSPLEVLQQQLASLATVVEVSLEHERKLKQIEAGQEELEHRLEAIDMETTANTAEIERFSNGHGMWVTIAGWCNRHEIKKPVQWMNTQGRKAAALCKQKGLKPVPVKDTRYGQVNTYPDTILAELNWD